MNRPRVSLVVLLLLATALTGCMGENGEQGTEPMTGMEARELANDEATSWSEDAQLVMLVGLELPPGHQMMDVGGDIDLQLAPDENVGDGVTPVWTATYHSQQLNDSYSFQVLPDDPINLTGAQDPNMDLAPLEDWSVDSDEAGDAARDSADFEEALQAENASASFSLRMTAGEPQWNVIASPGGGEEPVHLRVHAVDATVTRPS